MASDQNQPPDLARLLRTMAELNASDLHLKTGASPVVRIDGELIMLSEPVLTPATIDGFLEQLTTADQRASFARYQELDLAYHAEGIGRLRVNAAWQRGTVVLAVRLLHREPPTIEDLGLPPICASLMLKPRGFVLVTGPTGCGKSTTLAAMLGYLNEHARRHVITIEDPIEFVHEDGLCLFSQRELGSDTQSMAAALRHALRQDPDVILVGEMRDLDTFALALTAAETGHLVLATMHTPSAPQAVDRIIDAFPPHQQQQVRVQLSVTLEAVLCQELVRKADGMSRVPAIEILVATAAVRNLIREGKTFQLPGVLQTGAQFGMQTLEQALADLYHRNIIGREDALAHSSNPEDLERLMTSAPRRAFAA
ncbi:MAG: type IV pilus twitching motility protein PilT [Dehalococcoidia bacterium]